MKNCCINNTGLNNLKVINKFRRYIFHGTWSFDNYLIFEIHLHYKVNMTKTSLG